MEKNRFWDLLAKVKSGEATPEEQLELNQHLSAFPGDLALVKQIDGFWELPLPAKTAPAPEEVTTAWHLVRNKISAQRPPVQLPVASSNTRRITKYVSAIAAVFILAAGGIWLWNTYQVTAASPQKNIVSTKNGSKSKIELPDGTQVWLNVGSRIRYDENYGKENRELTLTGEACFDVAHDETKPFILHTGKMDVKVLGTLFNVKAYPGDETTEASLIRGSIEVTFPGRPQEKLILKPKDKISIVNKETDTAAETRVARAVNNDKPAIMVSSIQYEPTDSAVIETAWVNNKLIFRSKTFEELARDIERWFNVIVQVQDSSILDKKFTGTFSNESITDALDALSLTYPFHYKFNRSNNTVAIY
jgi:transmembrane sensor